MQRTPSHLARTIGAPILIVYMLIVALAGWPGQVRPAFLDAAHARAVSTLRLLGISAGQPLFHTTENPWKTRGHCLLIRAVGGEAEEEIVFPPEGECRLDGFHPRLPPMSRATHRMLSSAWKEAQQGRVRSAASDGYVHAIGRHFCRSGDPAPAEIEAVWTWYYLHYDTAAVQRMNGLQFAFDCRDEQLRRLTWHPPDADVLAFWGAAPWQ